MDFKISFPFLNKISFLRMVNNGALHITDDLEKNKIKTLNIVSISIYYLVAIITVVYAIYGFYWLVLLDFIIFFLHFTVKRLVKNGHFLLAKIIAFQTTTLFLFLSGTFYSYPLVLTHFYTISLIACLYIFSVKERYYMIFFMVQIITLFFCQAIYSKQLLMSFNVLASEKVELINVILLVTFGCYLFGLVFLIIKLNHYQEHKLIKIKNKLYSVKKTLMVHNAELQTFGLAATHSLKTPLFIINSFLNKIEANVIHHKNGQLNAYYFTLIKESNILNERYANDLVAYLSIYNIPNYLEYFDLNSYVEKCIKLYRLKYLNANIVTKVENITINSNPVFLKIIIENMLDNGLKYNTSEKPEIKIFVRKQKKSLAIFFKDNGIGISNDYAEKIFNPFNRINEIETSVGSGLGLTISKLVAYKMNASLVLYASNKTQGSTFKLTISHEG